MQGIKMQKYWVTWILFAGLLVPSMQVIMTPCQVKNIETQPRFATSLPRRALVQVVQIPPVFTQKVMVGRCVNATSEISGAPGNYFMCKQRYSSVELYIMENSSLSSITQFYNPNSTIQGILEGFKRNQFVREFVLVESGCDFTFNLLPFLLQRNQQAATYPNQIPHPSSSTHDNEEPHRFHFLKSPYHSNQQSTTQGQDTASHQLINSQYATPKTIRDQQQPLSSAPAIPYSITTPSTPIYSYSPYTQGGNSNNAEGNRPGGTTFNNHPSATGTGTTHNYVPPDSSTPSFYQPRGTYGGDSSTVQLQGRGKSEHPHHSSSPVPDYTHAETAHYKSPAAQISSPYAYSTQTSPESEPRPELYKFSDKIGVPLYILSPEVDPLLKNIESIDNHYSTN